MKIILLFIFFSINTTKFSFVKVTNKKTTNKETTSLFLWTKLFSRNESIANKGIPKYYIKRILKC